ncbi:hypothetical protein Ocin01_07908 [Orchesella cincta]|uniref:Uncharacterized protein n=1 Tax=Orchesella cincta TaxID=48709 RepID=A0A1D2N139_ORCCI|nr:hypothetical protein Ocin01_07908 [Orchesella cincta]
MWEDPLIRRRGMDSDFDGKSSDMGMSSPNFSLTSPGMSMNVYRHVTT